MIKLRRKYRHASHYAGNLQFRSLWCLIVALTALPTVNLEAEVDETAVKAQFLLRFRDFVYCDSPDDKTYQIAFLTPCPLYHLTLEAANAYPFPDAYSVFLVTEETDFPKIDLLYFEGESEGDRLPFIERAHANGILTVGSGEEFHAQGGIVSFIRTNDRIRFMLNYASLRSADLNASSKLISLSVNRP